MPGRQAQGDGLGTDLPLRAVRGLLSSAGDQSKASSVDWASGCKSGFLEEIKRGREKLFINHRFLNLLKKKEILL